MQLPSTKICCAGAVVGHASDSKHQQDTQSDAKTDVLVLNGQQKQPLDKLQQAVAKLDEFRAVAPVSHLGSIVLATSKHHPTMPPTRAMKTSLNESFRTRRLKDIKADNADNCQRVLQMSASHDTNDDRQREWPSMSKHPVSINSFNSFMSEHKDQSTGHDERNSFGLSLLQTSCCIKPSLKVPVIAQPTRSIPTSPKRLHLNMTPAFRSLRKAMPQQPSLPPLSSPRAKPRSSRAANSRLNDCSIDSTSSRRSITSPTTHFHEADYRKQVDAKVVEDATYQLLKTGRFVGGTYLLLTVFCGDGVVNPYGFDLLAYDRHRQCEYKLIITKEMVHELLDKSSSSSLAAETAAAAGTNMSMSEIAQRLCDHVNFALLGPDQGEMVFLVPNIARKSHRTMRFDASPRHVAFCLHQRVTISDTTDHEPSSHSSSHLVSNTKKLTHVYASTCPRHDSSDSVTNSEEVRICFELKDSSLSWVQDKAFLKVAMSLNDLYDIVLSDSHQLHQRLWSMERIVVAAIQHLRIISAPSDDADLNILRNKLIVSSHAKTRLLSRCHGPMQGKRLSMQHFLHSTSQFFAFPAHAFLLMQSGLIWRKGYLLTLIALDCAANETDLKAVHLLPLPACAVIVRVFNATSRRSSSRILSREKVVVLWQKLNLLKINDPPIDNIRAFVAQLLSFLELNVNLFGQETIVFPVLEHSNACQSTDQEAAKPMKKRTLLEKQVQESTTHTSSKDESARVFKDNQDKDTVINPEIKETRIC